jgi:transcriptional regulator with XRE-family HTH domain
MSQEAAAAGIGVTRQTLSAWEAGRGEPLATDLQRLAALYGVSLDEIAGRVPLRPPTE